MGYKYLYPLEKYPEGKLTDAIRTYPGHDSSTGGGKLDIRGHAGKNVLSMTDGTVAWTGTTSSGDPMVVVVASGPTTPSGGPLAIRYVHVDNHKVKAGDVVKQGDVLATVQAVVTGTSTGPHLHMDFIDSSTIGTNIGHFTSGIPNYSGLQSEQAINTWKSQGGKYGFCWNVFGTPATYIQSQLTTGSGGTGISGGIERSTLYKGAEPPAATAYFEREFTEAFMQGPRPTNASSANQLVGLMRWYSRSKAEFGAWTFAAAAGYGKLLRATILGMSSYFNSSGATTLNNWLVTSMNNRPGWVFSASNLGNQPKNANSSNFSLEYAQALYDNIRYPNVYGENLDNTSADFKRLVVKAASFIPLHNGSVRSTWAGSPFSALAKTTTGKRCAVLYTPSTGIDDIEKYESGQSANITPRMGTFLLYRLANSMGFSEGGTECNTRPFS